MRESWERLLTSGATTMPTIDLNDSFLQLHARLDRLESESAIRRLFTRYMQLCDVPCVQPEGVAEALGGLFSPDAVWQGVGRLYTSKFGVLRGRAAIINMLMSYLPPSPHFRTNGHLLGSEHIDVEGDQARGSWLMQQLSDYEEGSADLILARLDIHFIRINGVWLISQFQTERLLSSPLTLA